MGSAAVCIGIGTYKSLASLAGPVRDATEFHKWVVNPAGGGVAPSRAHLITSEDFDPAWDGPVLSHLYAAFNSLVGECARQERVGERLILFFAGHGIASKGSADVAGLVTPDTGLDFAIATDVRRYYDYFVRAGCFEEIIFIFDCCRSVDPSSDPVPPPLAVLAARRPTLKTFVAFGGPYAGVAREQDFPGHGVHGYLTRALLDGLDGAAGSAGASREPMVSGTALRRFAYSRLDEFQARWGNVPTVQITADDRLEVRFGLPGGGARLVEIRVASPANLPVILRDGRDTVVSPMSATGSHASITYRVPVGLYRFTVDGADQEPFSLTGDLDVSF